MALIPGLDNIWQQPQGNPLGFTMAGIADDRSNENTDFGLASFKNQRDFTRGQSDLVDRFSDRGTARSGMLSKASDRMSQDYQFNQGQAELLHRRKLSDLDRQRLFATMGVLS